MDIEDRIFSIIEKLNPSQKEAVMAINGPVQVIAGAGSGKTRVLTTRIAYLIYSGVEPSQILTLTFTNKAANEMKDRIATILNPALANKIWAGTFHSIFARILRVEAEEIGFTRDFTIYDQEDSTSLVRQVMKDLNVATNELSPQSVQNYISKLKNEMVTALDYAQIARTTFEKKISSIYLNYQDELFKNKAMDFDDLLLHTLELFLTHKDILEKYQKRFKYILVDEFQDTNKPQYRIIWNLAKAHSNIFVVGDDAQSIYGWRGAEIKNILNFTKDFPAAKLIRLEQNYRSTANILDAAHSVIINNRNQIPKKLWTENEKGHKVRVLVAETDNDEGTEIANQIIELQKLGFGYGDIAILYRTNAQSLLLEKALRTYNIPYKIFGGLSFYQRKEIKDVLAYLRLLINPNDNISLLRIVNEPPRGIGKTTLEHTIAYAKGNQISLYQAFLNAQNIEGLQNRAVIALKTFIEFIEKHRQQLEQDPLDEFVVDYIYATGLIDMYKQIDSTEMTEKLNNINQLLNDIILFARDNPNQTLSDYLQQISLLTDFDTKTFDGQTVSLMTLHTAKGLEFPVVFITGLEKGLTPLQRSNNSFDEEEEERRLFYVGMTRAKNRLFLTYARQRARFGNYQYQSPSTFLLEIDQNLLDWPDHPSKTVKATQTKTSIFQSTTTNYFNDMPQYQTYSQLPEDQGFRLGERVLHPYFGEGKIVGISGANQNLKLTIDFTSVGRKQIMVAYAKLQKI